MEQLLALGLWGDDGFVCVGVFAMIFFLATSVRRPSHRCPRCQEINRPPATFCAQCGQRLPGR